MGKEKKMNNEKRFNSPFKQKLVFSMPAAPGKIFNIFFGKNKSQKGAKYIIQQK